LIRPAVARQIQKRLKLDNEKQTPAIAFAFLRRVALVLSGTVFSIWKSVAPMM